jgi:hypothetical protein
MIQTQMVWYFSEFLQLSTHFRSSLIWIWGGLCNFAGIPLELLKSIQIGPRPEEEGEQRKGGRVSVERAIDVEVRGEEKFQELTAVRLGNLSRAGMARKGDLHGSLKRRRRSQWRRRCSGNQHRWRTCAWASVSHEGCTDAVNWEHKLWNRDDRRR